MEPATVMNFNDFIKSFPHEVASQIDAHFWRQKLNFNENQKHLFAESLSSSSSSSSLKTIFLRSDIWLIVFTFPAFNVFKGPAFKAEKKKQKSQRQVFEATVWDVAVSRNRDISNKNKFRANLVLKLGITKTFCMYLKFG